MGMRYIRVAGIGEIKQGEYKRVSPERGEHVLVCNVGGTIYALTRIHRWTARGQGKGVRELQAR